MTKPPAAAASGRPFSSALINGRLPPDPVPRTSVSPCASNPTPGFYCDLPARDVTEVPMPHEEVAIQPESHSMLASSAEASKREIAPARLRKPPVGTGADPIVSDR